jgi:hypothetical protein
LEAPGGAILEKSNRAPHFPIILEILICRVDDAGMLVDNVSRPSNCPRRQTMDPSEQILEACKQIALQLMKIHPAIGKLNAPETQAACLKSAHQLTVELETIKKQVIRLKQRDDSTEL